MIPKYVRVVLPTNKNIQLLVPAQQPLLQGLRCATPRPILPNNLTDSVIQSQTVSPSIQSTCVPISSSSASSFQQQISEQTASASTPITSPSLDDFTMKQSNSETSLSDKSTSKLSSSSTPTPSKRNRSCLYGTNATDSKKSEMIESDDNYQKQFKRAKNLSEEETSTFINVWSEYYDRLSTGGSRNMPLYHAMAQQLNTMLSPRVMTATDVKSKIFNLVAEYRKRKKDQGKTGASPCTWRYFDLIDKLLGERPYNDDSLMADTMIIQNDVTIDDVENISMNNSTGNRPGEEIDLISSSAKDVEEVAKDCRSSISNSPSNASSSPKVTSQNPIDSSVNKSCPRKKKKISDIRIDLIQQMLTKIDNANEMANQAESKALTLLEKQTKIQEESLSYEKEFLNIFKNIANNFNHNR